MTPSENCYILGYTDPNVISEDVLEMVQTVLSMVLILELEDEPVTHGSPYNFAMLNSPITSQLRK